MGLISIVLVDHDALHHIEEDKAFGSKLNDVVIVGANSGGRTKPGVIAQGKGRTGTFGDAAKYIGTFDTQGGGIVLIEGGGAKRLEYEEYLHLCKSLRLFRKKNAKRKGSGHEG